MHISAYLPSELGEQDAREPSNDNPHDSVPHTPWRAIRIRAIDRGVRVPSLDLPSAAEQNNSLTVPLLLTVEELLFGVLPPSTFPTILAILFFVPTASWAASVLLLPRVRQMVGQGDMKID